MKLARWKIGDRVLFDDFAVSSFGTIREVTEREGADTLYGVDWDDGFDDGYGNILAEWELNDPTEVEYERT